MSYQDHFRTCPYCNKGLLSSKPTVRVKSASSANIRRKLAALGGLVKGASNSNYNPKDYFDFQNPMESRSKSRPGPLERAYKLKELSKLIRDYQ
jgi:hypothetical protein